MEGQVDLTIGGDFPKGIGRVSTLIDNHAIDHREEDHDLEVNLGHLFEEAIMEVQLVIDLLLFKNKSLDLSPTAELLVWLAVGKTAGYELIDTVILVLVKGNLTLSRKIVTKDSFGEDLPSLFVEGILEVDKFIDDDSQ